MKALVLITKWSQVTINEDTCAFAPASVIEASNDDACASSGRVDRTPQLCACIDM